jgi:hypothetical protein
LAVRKYAVIVSATALAYFSLFQLNNYFFSSFGFSEGVSWIFLPSGLRLAFILLFVESGALGIALASVLISYFYQFEGNLLTIAGAGFLSGFAPWLARLICIDKFKLDVNLKNLTSATLVKISVLFSVLSSVLHQLWYTLRGVTEDFVSSAAVMAFGDMLGTIVILYAAKGLLALVPVTRNN